MPVPSLLQGLEECGKGFVAMNFMRGILGDSIQPMSLASDEDWLLNNATVSVIILNWNGISTKYIK